MKDLNSTTPAAPTGRVNVQWQADISGHVSGSVPSPSAQLRTIVLSIDGGSSTPTTPIRRSIQVPFAAIIVGWSIDNVDASGSLSCDVSKLGSSAPPSAPAIPDPITNKISASAPISMTGALSASGGATAISSWTTLAVAQWDVVQFVITSATTLKRASIQLFVQP